MPQETMLLLPPAGVAIVDEHGDSHAKDMLPQFESHLESRGGGDHSDDEEAHDRVREGVVVLLGTLARHMDPADPKACLSAACNVAPDQAIADCACGALCEGVGVVWQ